MRRAPIRAAKPRDHSGLQVLPETGSSERQGHRPVIPAPWIQLAKPRHCRPPAASFKRPHRLSGGRLTELDEASGSRCHSRAPRPGDTALSSGRGGTREHRTHTQTAGNLFSALLPRVGTCAHGDAQFNRRPALGRFFCAAYGGFGNWNTVSFVKQRPTCRRRRFGCS